MGDIPEIANELASPFRHFTLIRAFLSPLSSP